jgi:hypothetical protein
MQKTKALTAVLLSFLLLPALTSLSTVTADVYVPPGPPYSMDAWISPHLWVFDLQDNSPIGWRYSDGPMYDPITQEEMGKIHKSNPEVPPFNKLDIPWSTEVMILGFVPGVAVAPDQVPPPVEIVITWNGIPWVVTLELPECPEPQIVGYEYPPMFYDDINDTYEFAWPAESPYKDAHYNIWVGDEAHLVEHLFGWEVPPYWYETSYGIWNGLWFWYVFHPNVGDYIAYNCMGETKFPPTYDITALFEFGTSQIWFPHICFDVKLLEVHKEVYWTGEDELLDIVTIENVGKECATELDFIQTFPYYSDHPLQVGVIPDFDSAMARIDGPDRTVGWTALPGFGEAMRTRTPYMLPPPFDYLCPGEIMTIRLELTVDNPLDWFGTIVFDSMVSAHQIPPWKEPIAMHSVTIGTPPQRFAVVIGDAPAHAAPSGIGYFVNDGGTAYGGDPGPDEVMFTDDDLDYWPTIQKLWDEGTTVFAVNYNPNYIDAFYSFSYMAGGTGGVYYVGGDAWDTMIVDQIVGRIGDHCRADVIFTIDLSGSMAINLDDVKNKIKSLIDNMPGTMDVTFGLGTHVDYPGFYDSYGYAAWYGDGSFGDYAWSMDVDLTHDREFVKWVVDGLTPYFGADGPQNFVRVLFEIQFFSREHVPLWCGWKLLYDCWYDPYWDEWFCEWRFDFICEWFVPWPILRDELTHPPPEMILDPIPVDLNDDYVIDAQDVELVRQAIVGLVAYDLRMDTNVNNKIDTQDLAAFKLAAAR